MAEKYDVVVGIPSRNEATTIPHVTRMADEGLKSYFSNERCIIVNCDNDSPDNTKDSFLSTETKTPKKYISTPEGVKGKGNNFWNLFHFFQQAEAKIGIVVDADLQSIHPEWIKFLGHPIRDGNDMVTPLYSRHQFDGTITNHICYPLIYALTGFNIRQPIGGDFAFSPGLCSHWLNKPWSETTRQYGIDIFMTLHALFGGYKICQAGLGSKIHKASTPKLGQMFDEVVHTLFSILVENRSTWLRACRRENCNGKDVGVGEVPLTGLRKLSPPQDLEIDIVKLKNDCRAEYDQHAKHVKKYLSPYACHKIDTMFDTDHYSMNIMLWSQIVYSLLYSFDLASKEERAEIINALKPLYFSRSITFNYKTWRYNVVFAEHEVEDQAKGFSSQKPYLLGLYLQGGTFLDLQEADARS